jgi:hypothetical protein
MSFIEPRKQMRRLSIALLALLLVAPTDVFARCGPSRLRGNVTKPETIKLNGAERGVRDAPAFYLRMANPWVILLFKPEDIVEQLKKDGARYHAEDLATAAGQTQKYFDAISRDLPLKENTDLFKYVLQERGFATRQDFMVSELLKLGQVYVDEWPFQDAKRDPLYDNDDPTTLTMISKGEGETEEVRYFCESGHKELFSITYIIND